MNISVIIPCYNHADEVAQAIESALSQTRPPDEIIAVDDGSTDGSAGVIARFKEVKLIRQENEGPAAARNAAAREAKGDWLALLDADDIWLPEKLAEQQECIKTRPDAALVHTNGWVIEGREAPEKLESRPTWFQTKTPPEGTQAYKTFLSTPILTSSVMVKKEVFDKEGGFDTSFTINEDADLFFRIMATGKRVCYVPRPLMVQRCVRSGAGRDQQAYLTYSIKLLKKARTRFPEHADRLKRSIGATYRISAWYAMREGKPGMARKCWLNSFLYRRPGRKELLTAALLLLGRRGFELARSMWIEVIKGLR